MGVLVSECVVFIKCVVFINGPLCDLPSGKRYASDPSALLNRCRLDPASADTFLLTAYREWNISMIESSCCVEPVEASALI
jgi:hypothetical protein